MTDQAPVKAGDVLAGKYRVDRVLGVGGMGVVVAATHVDLGEVRALKFMLPRVRDNQQAVERFLREARASVKLKSDHVVSVYDVGRFETGEPYMVMEYLEGNDLNRAIEEYGALPIDSACDYVLQACDAIAEAHSLGIIHRDLKPANLFLTVEKGEPCIKVLDFGISKLTGDLAKGEGHDMTKTATILGSPYYMSPEQMRSTRSVDTRADIWSLGVILYQLLTGELPFTGESITELCGQVFTEPPVPPLQRRPELPVELGAVLLRCLEKEAAARYANVAELALAIAPFAGPGGERRAERIADALGVATRAKTQPMPPMQHFAVPAATGGQPTDSSWANAVETRSSRRPLLIGAAVLLLGLGGAAAWRSLAGSSEAEVVREAPAASTPPVTSDAPVVATVTAPVIASAPAASSTSSAASSAVASTAPSASAAPVAARGRRRAPPPPPVAAPPPRQPPPAEPKPPPRKGDAFGDGRQ